MPTTTFTEFSNTTIGSGTTVTASSGQLYDSVVIAGGGELVVASGGMAGNVTVDDGGVLSVKRDGDVTDVSVTSGGDLSLAPGATAATIMFSGGTLELASGSGGAAGTLDGLGSAFTGFDVLDVDKSATWTLSGTILPSTVTATSTITGTTTPTMTSGTTTLSVTTVTETTGPMLSNGGTVTLGGDFYFQKITGAGELMLGNASTLEVAGTVAGSQTIGFAGNDTLNLDTPAGLNGTLLDFFAGDTLDLSGFNANTASYTETSGTGTLTVFRANGAGQTLTFTLEGVPSGTNFTVTHLTSPGETVITDDATCFCPGTRIRTPRGEVAVEALAIGDVVLTHAGAAAPIRWIGRRSYGGRFLAGKRHVLPVRVRAGALAENVPCRDLCLSPNHALYLDGVLIPVIELVNGVSVVQESPEFVEYFHIELAEHGVILAEGAPAETFVDDDSRAIFHNAEEYAARYPGASRVPAVYCAPRLTEGYVLEAIRRRIAERAGVTMPAPGLGALRGCLDRVSGDEVRGWAQNSGHPEVPVCLDVLVNGVLAAQTLAGVYREDLQRAGLGSGCHSFAVRLASPLPASGVVEVRRSADAALLARVTLDRAVRAVG